MTEWRTAPALVALRDEVNAKYPKRDKASDGVIGDPRHQVTSYSDHNPLWKTRDDSPLHGVVRAMDIDSNGKPGEVTPLVSLLLTNLIGDPRVWYVIWNGKVYSRTYGWSPRVYLGARHDRHVHVSLQGHNLPNEDGQAARAIAADTSPWLPKKKPTPVPSLPPVRLSSARLAASRPRRKIKPVTTRRIQRALTAQGIPVPVDGVYGPKTRAAYVTWQRRIGATGTGIPAIGSLTKLGANRFRVLR